MRIVEFYVPRELTDLEKKPADPAECTRYFVECVMDVKGMAESEQISTLQAVLNEMSSNRRSSRGQGPIAIFDSSKFDPLYSYVKYSEHLTRESKVLLCNELPQLLKKLCKQVVHVLSKRETGCKESGDSSPQIEIDRNFDVIARSALKMYCCLICNLVLHVENPSRQAHPGDLSLANTSDSTLRQGGIRPKQKSRGTTNTGESDIDITSKELALTALLGVLSSDLYQIWKKLLQPSRGNASNDTNTIQGDSFDDSEDQSSTFQNAEEMIVGYCAHIDDALLHLIYTVTLKILSRKSNLFEITNTSSRTGDLTSVGHVTHMLLLALAHHLICVTDYSMDTQAQQHLQNNSSNREMEATENEYQTGQKLSLDLESRRKLAHSYYRNSSISPTMKDEFLSPICELMIKFEFVAKYIASFTQTVHTEAEHSFGISEEHDRNEQSLDSGALSQEKWAKRMLRGILEVISEYCGIIPKIVESASIKSISDSVKTALNQEEPDETINENQSSPNLSIDSPLPIAKSWKIVYVASLNLGIDNSSCKNLVAFFDFFVDHNASIISDNFDLFKPLLTHCENYDIRKSMVSILAEIIQEKHVEVSRLKACLSKTESNESSVEVRTYKNACESYIELLNLLFERLMDVSAVVRTHTIRGFIILWEKKVMPLPYQLRLFEGIVLRLDDRNNHTRKAAFGFVTIAISKNSFTSRYLSLKRLMLKKVQLEKEIEALTLPSEGRSSSRRTSSTLIDDGSPTYSRISEFPSIPQENIAIEDNEGDFSHQYLPGDTISQKKLKLKFYSMGTRFIESVHKAVDVAFVMLRSRVLADVLEAIDLIAKANELRVDIAMEESYKIFPFIYSEEVTVQEAIRTAFCNMLFMQFRKQSNIPLVYRNFACIKNFIHLLSGCEEEIITAIETICSHLATKTSAQQVITDDILSTVWGIVNGDTVLPSGSIQREKEGEAIFEDRKDRRYAMKLYSILVLAYPSHIRDRTSEIVEKLLSRWAADNIMCCYLFRSLERLSLINGFSHMRISDPLMGLISEQIVRPAKEIGPWMMMTERALSLISSLCQTPFYAFEYLLTTSENYLLSIIPKRIAKKIFSSHEDFDINSNHRNSSELDIQVSLIQFVFLLGHIVLKQYIHIDKWERNALSQIELGKEYSSLLLEPNSIRMVHKESKKRSFEATDTMEKELGFDSKEYHREEVRETAEKAREELTASGSLSHKYIPSLMGWVSVVLQNSTNLEEEDASRDDPQIANLLLGIHQSPWWRNACVLTLEKLMIVSEAVCKQNIRLLFTVLKHSPQWWIRTNCLVGIGDLLCAHPNTVQPYLHPSEGHITMLLDPETDLSVRHTTVALCIHLALNDMLRIPEMTPYLLSLIGDDDVAIAKLGLNFLHELHAKNKNIVYNLLPVVCMHLCKVYQNNEEKFCASMKSVMEKIEKDKQAESIVEKLCSKYPAFSAQGTTDFDLVVARYLTFCLNELNYSNDRVVIKLCSEANFQYYKRWMTDSHVRRLFMNIVTKVRRSGHSTSTYEIDSKDSVSNSQSTTLRVGGDRRSRIAMLDEWESRVRLFLQAGSECDTTEKQNEVESHRGAIASNSSEHAEGHHPETEIHIQQRTVCTDSENDILGV